VSFARKRAARFTLADVAHQPPTNPGAARPECASTPVSEPRTACPCPFARRTSTARVRSAYSGESTRRPRTRQALRRVELHERITDMLEKQSQLLLVVVPDRLARGAPFFAIVPAHRIRPGRSKPAISAMPRGSPRRLARDLTRPGHCCAPKRAVRSWMEEDRAERSWSERR